MPTLFRLIFFGGALVASIYAVMLTLVLLVDPGEREIRVAVPPGSLAPPAGTETPR